MSFVKNKYNKILKEAGIDEKEFQAHKDSVYRRIFWNGSLGFGESYMDGDWDSCDVYELLCKILNYSRNNHVEFKNGFAAFFLTIFNLFGNLQSKARSFIVGETHYNTSNFLFTKMLDKNMIYSCGYWKGAKDLDEAQENKLKLVFDKLNLKKGMEVLDIGCGWGGAAKFVAERYGVKVTAITISTEQAKLAEEVCKGLPVKVLVKDYRDLNMNDHFDRIYSIGMFEHVGRKNYKDYMKKCRELLKDDGLFVLHTIGKSYRNKYPPVDPWIEKYIFPNGYIPALSDVTKSAEHIFEVEDIQNFGPDYTKTLLSWRKNFIDNWDDIKKESVYDERFYRMWTYYLSICAAAFKVRNLQLFHFVLSKHGEKDRYDSPR